MKNAAPGTGTGKTPRGRPLSLITRWEQPQTPLYSPVAYYPLSAVSAPPCIQPRSVPLAEPQLAFQPERHYLLLALHRENLRATSLARKIPPLETALATATQQKARRNAKKQISWISSRLRESARQEQIILDRLDQLSFEENTNRYWAQIEHERRLSQQMINFEEATNRYWVQLAHERRLSQQMISHQAAMCRQQLCIMTWNLQNTQLEPTTSEFQPTEYPFPRQDTPLNGDAPVWLPVNFEISRKESCRGGWEELSPLEEESECGSEVGTTALTTPEARKTLVIGEAASESDVSLDWMGTDEEEQMGVEGRLEGRKGRSLPTMGSEKWVELKGKGKEREGKGC